MAPRAATSWASTSPRSRALGRSVRCRIRCHRTRAERSSSTLASGRHSWGGAGRSCSSCVGGAWGEGSGEGPWERRGPGGPLGRSRRPSDRAPQASGAGPPGIPGGAGRRRLPSVRLRLASLAAARRRASGGTDCVCVAEKRPGFGRSLPLGRSNPAPSPICPSGRPRVPAACKLTGSWPSHGGRREVGGGSPARARESARVDNTAGGNRALNTGSAHPHVQGARGEGPPGTEGLGPAAGAALPRRPAPCDCGSPPTPIVNPLFPSGSVGCFLRGVLSFPGVFPPRSVRRLLFPRQTLSVHGVLQ